MVIWISVQNSWICEPFWVSVLVKYRILLNCRFNIYVELSSVLWIAALLNGTELIEQTIVSRYLKCYKTFPRESEVKFRSNPRVSCNCTGQLRTSQRWAKGSAHGIKWKMCKSDTWWIKSKGWTASLELKTRTQCSFYKEMSSKVVSIDSWHHVMSLCTVLFLTLCYVSLRSINLLIPEIYFSNKASINSS